MIGDGSTPDSGSPPPSRRWLIGVVVVGAAYLVGIVVLGGDDAREAGAGAGTPALIGAVVAVDRLTQSGVPGVAATAGVALTGPISLTMIARLSVVGIAAATITGEAPGMFLAVVLVVLIILVAIGATIVTVLRSPVVGERLIEGVARRSPRLRRRRAAGWRAAWHGLAGTGPSPGQTSAIIGWAVVKRVADVASLAVVYAAVGEDPRLAVLLAGFAVWQVLAAVPLTPGEVGVVESGMVGVFVVFGVPAGSAVTIAILYRVGEMWLPTAAGVPTLARGVAR